MSWRKPLERWQAAGLIDSETAERIRGYETGRDSAPRLRWQAVLALAFGALLLGAGVLLYVAAKWDFLTPGWRLALIVSLTAVFHVAGAATARWFRALSVALHAVGTVALGGSIFAAGEVVYISQGAVGPALMLWAAGAWLGVLLLRDWPQIGLAAVVTPAWLVAEWSDRFLHESPALSSVFVFLTATAYLMARKSGQDATWRLVLTILGIAALIPAAAVTGFTRPGDILARALWGWAPAFLLPLGVAYFLCGKAAWRQLLWTCWAATAVAIQYFKWELAAYLWCAAGAVLLTEWGLRESRAERINLGVIGFAATVIGFYFSSVLSNVDRSVSLIVLGLLFLGGGWQLEKLRRRLISRLRKEPS